MDDFIDSARGDSKIPTQPVLADPHRLKELLVQDFPWMYRHDFFHLFTSMVVGNLDTVCVSIFPFETDPPLLVDPNAVLSPSISR